MNAGYSGRPLVEKLGIKAGMRIALVNPPDDYPLPEGVELVDPPVAPLDFAHLFVANRADMEAAFPALKQALARDGMLWISWHKKSAKIPTDLDDNVVREFGLANGLVDVKVVAVDAVWSGLKLVYRLKDR